MERRPHWARPEGFCVVSLHTDPPPTPARSKQAPLTELGSPLGGPWSHQLLGPKSLLGQQDGRNPICQRNELFCSPAGLLGTGGSLPPAVSISRSTSPGKCNVLCNDV